MGCMYLLFLVVFFFAYLAGSRIRHTHSEANEREFRINEEAINRLFFVFFSFNSVVRTTTKINNK